MFQIQSKLQKSLSFWSFPISPLYMYPPLVQFLNTPLYEVEENYKK